MPSFEVTSAPSDHRMPGRSLNQFERFLADLIQPDPEGEPICRGMEVEIGKKAAGERRVVAVEQDAEDEPPGFAWRRGTGNWSEVVHKLQQVVSG